MTITRGTLPPIGRHLTLLPEVPGGVKPVGPQHAMKAQSRPVGGLHPRPILAPGQRIAAPSVFSFLHEQRPAAATRAWQQSHVRRWVHDTVCEEMYALTQTGARVAEGGITVSLRYRWHDGTLALLPYESLQHRDGILDMPLRCLVEGSRIAANMPEWADANFWKTFRAREPQHTVDAARSVTSAVVALHGRSWLMPMGEPAIDVVGEPNMRFIVACLQRSIEASGMREFRERSRLQRAGVYPECIQLQLWCDAGQVVGALVNSAVVHCGATSTPRLFGQPRGEKMSTIWHVGDMLRDEPRALPLMVGAEARDDASIETWNLVRQLTEYRHGDQQRQRTRIRSALFWNNAKHRPLLYDLDGHLHHVAEHGESGHYALVQDARGRMALRDNRLRRADDTVLAVLQLSAQDEALGLGVSIKRTAGELPSHIESALADAVRLHNIQQVRDRDDRRGRVRRAARLIRRIPAGAIRRARHFLPRD